MSSPNESDDFHDIIDVQPWQRSYLGFKERFVSDFFLPLSNGKTIRISQAPKASAVAASSKQHSGREGKGSWPGQQGRSGRLSRSVVAGPRAPPASLVDPLDRVHDPGITGSTVWDAGIVLAQFLTNIYACEEGIRKESPLSSFLRDIFENNSQHLPTMSGAPKCAAPTTETVVNTVSEYSPNEGSHQSDPHESGEVALSSLSLQISCLHNDECTVVTDACSSAQLTGPPLPTSLPSHPKPLLRVHGDHYSNADGRPPVVIELGSGTGIVSLALACTWHIGNIVMTDISSILPLLQKNVQLNRMLLNRGTRVHVHALRWGVAEDVEKIECLKDGQRCDILVGSDLIYSDTIAQDALLITTFHRVCHSQTNVFLAMHLLHQPGRVQAFIDRLQGHFAKVNIIPTVHQAEGWRTHDVVVVHCSGLLRLGGNERREECDT